ncbi:MAG TPA: TonB-dependent receptor [Bryobacteraceae bacterium]|jgi:hypothetical protein|nr:TonB-dependent receptor [Bryobacteraceae bacterium]
MSIESAKQSVTVNSSDRLAIRAEPEQQNEIDRSTILNAPTTDDRADTLLPLIPGVVRGPGGLINMKGARSSQAGALVNNTSVVDPVTGNPAMSLPIDVVELVAVIANPYDPEYGRFAGAVTKTETTTGNFDDFHFRIQNLFPRPRKRDGDFVGLEAATPRATLTGPLIKHKVAFTESFEYRFIRTPVDSLPQLQRDVKFEGFTWFNQVDVNLNAQQSMTATFTLYPQKLNYLGLNTFTPQPSTPDLHQRGYMVSLQHRLAINSDSLLLSQVSYKRFDVDLTPNSTAPYELRVETTTGGFFDRQARQSGHTEWEEIYQRELRGFAGTNELKFGVDYVHDSYDGRIGLLPVTIIGVANVPLEQISFGPAARFNIPQNAIAWFLADRWQPVQRLTIDLGLRFDRDSITDSVNAAPRAGFALMLTKDAKTVLKGGAGLFYDRVPMNVASFPLLPSRTIAMLSADGGILSSESLVNEIPGGLSNPRSLGWNVELDRQLSSAFVIRAGFQERNTVRDFVLDPQAALGLLTLINDGHSFYREFQLTGRYKVKRGTLNASYVRSKTFGNLNDFNHFFGNNPVAAINSDEQGRLPFDAPNRFLAWGQWDAPFKFTVLPVLDVHTGFPYSLIDQTREFVGPRDSERFPHFASLDLQVTRPIKLHIGSEKLKARVGFSVFNLLNRFNPRDVQSDTDSGRFGEMFNSVGRTWRGKFILEF